MKIPSLALILLLAPTAVLARAADKPVIQLGVTAGSLGIGPEVMFRPARHFGARINAGYFTYSRDENVDDILYDGRLKLKSVGVLADLYPFGGNLRLSAGARINRNRVRLTASPATSVAVGNTVYTPAQIGTLNGTIRVKEFTPQLTLGYAGMIGKRLYAGIEAGVLYQGAPHVDTLTATGLLATDPVFRADLVAEEAKIEDKIDGYKIYPVVQLMLGYTF